MASSKTSRLRETMERTKVEVFYDADCPLCRKEIKILRWLDRRNRIRFSDISADDFDPDTVGRSQEELMDEIHGRDCNGNLIKGVEVFRQLYAAVGFGWLAALSRLPVFSHALNWSYRWFARNRLRLTGRRDKHCTAKTERIAAGST